MDPLIGFALDHAEQTPLHHLEGVGFEVGQDEQEPIFRCRQGAVFATIRSKAKLLLHGMKSLCYGDPVAFNSEAFGNQEDHHGLPLACGDNIQTDCVGS